METKLSENTLKELATLDSWNLYHLPAFIRELQYTDPVNKAFDAYCDAIRRMKNNNLKIQAIKLVKEHTGMGLKDAHSLVNRI